MYKIDFKKPSHIHFIGIGGVSMSGLAQLLLTKGFTVSGSDWKASALTDELTAMGATVFIGQDASNITDDINAVIYTAAVKADNPELVEAGRKDIPALTRAELMGQVMLEYKSSIGVSGTHGKTTTTSLLSLILLDAGLDPTISVGGVLPEIKGNFRVGHGDHFVVESCEYTNSFLDFHPQDAIILNIAADHLDFFKDLEEIRQSFRRFADLVPADGITVVNSEITDYEALFKDIQSTVVTYGLEEEGSCDRTYNYMAKNISYDSMGRGIYDLYENGEKIGQVELGLVGRHNVSNSLAAIAVARKYGVPMESMLKTLKSFTGTDRRFQYKGSLGSIKIYDDYAHHPDEIAATLSAAQKYDKNRLITIFQPHTFSRTKALLHEFADSLSLSDVVVLAKIYPAREVDTGETSSRQIMELLEKKGKEVYYFESFDEIENFLLEYADHNDLLITMGAGDVVNIGDSLLGH